MATRLLRATPETKRRAQPPDRREGWKQLLKKAIAKAESIKDSRLEGLKGALRNDEAEKYLRLFGIINERDLAREFPVKVDRE